MRRGLGQLRISRLTSLSPPGLAQVSASTDLAHPRASGLRETSLGLLAVMRTLSHIHQALYSRTLVSSN